MHSKGFDSKRYVEEQTKYILERVRESSSGHLYIECGGKLLHDKHASRVLPGFDENNKMKVFQSLKDSLDIMINSPMEEEALKNFYETKGYVAGEANHLLKVIEVTGDYTSALSELAGRVYDELIAYMESSEWSWEKFKEEGNKVEIIVKIYDAYIEDGEDNKKSFLFMALNHVPNE